MKNTEQANTSKPFGVIYKCTNKINGKVYIGQTRQSFSARKRQHKNQAENNSSTYFHKALKKYGFDNFQWEILLVCFSLCELNKKEIYFISFFSSADKTKGYNIKLGGDNYQIAEETKIKIGKANKGKIHSPEAKEKMSKSRTGNKHFRFGKQLTEEHKQKLREKRLGTKHSEETKKKFSESRKGVNNSRFGKGKPMSENQKEKYKIIFSGEKNPMFGKKHSEDTKQKIREKAKGRISPTAKKVIDTSNNKLFNSAREAADFYNINHGTLKDRLNGKRTNKTTLKYYDN